MSPSTLQTKTKALSRLVKEESLYQKEFKEQKEAVEKLKSDPKADEYNLRTQVQILEESEKMIPAIRKKVQERLEDLKEYLFNYDENESTDDAKKVIEEAESILN